ncbi:MAG: SRPBCC family protein [Pseudomonadota bacterium]
MILAARPQSQGRIVEVRKDWGVNAPALAVWQMITGECAILDWHDRIATCRSYLNDQGLLTRDYVLHAEPGETPITMVETELLRSDPIMTITYVVEIQGLPITDYHAQMMVTPETEDRALATIRSRFVMYPTGDPALDARDIVAGFYQSGLLKLADVVGR